MTVTETADAIAQDFAYLDDWEMRYAHLIDLGKNNPPLTPDERTEDNKVRGCASQVWMVIDTVDQTRLAIRAESDALIVSGLISLLTRLFSNATAEDILAFDANAYLEQIGVTGALSAQRSNGLAAMLRRIRETAAAL